MSYISKYDTKFITFINRKYRNLGVFFNFFDDYILWLYYDVFKENEKKYYSKLEEDLMEYSNMQTGSPRQSELKEILKGMSNYVKDQK